MSPFQFFLLAFLCVTTAPASAGLFSDDEARQQIQQVEARLGVVEVELAKLESRLALIEQSLSKMEAENKQQASAQTNAMLDLQTTIQAQAADLRKLRGFNEELTHNLQDAEKRQKSFYVDLDARLRRFEAVDIAVASKVDGNNTKSDDLITENRALEAAYSFYKAERYQNAINAFQEFLTNFPQSDHIANIRYWMGNSYFVLKDYKNSLENYQILINNFKDYPKLTEAYLNVADCQELLNDKKAARLTLKQIIAKFPDTEAASKAKKRISTHK